MSTRDTGEPSREAEPKEKKPELRVVDKRWWARGEATPDADSGGRKPTYVEDLERRLGDATTALQGAQADRLRALAEFEQAKNRIRRDVARDVERGRRAVLTELLDVLDNLDRAIDAVRRSDASDDGRTIMRGVEIVREQFRAKLEAFGVTLIPSFGRPFDVALHEAVSTAPVSDPSEDGVIVAVLKEGYAIGEELLRPASVVVGQLQPHQGG